MYGMLGTKKIVSRRVWWTSDLATKNLGRERGKLLLISFESWLC